MGFNPDIVALLSCPRDPGYALAAGVAAFSCDRCGRAYPVRGDRVFFTEPPADISLFRNAEPTDRARWTTWRRGNFSFFERHLHARSVEDILVDIGAGTAPFRDLTGRFRVAVGVDFYPAERVQVVADLMRTLPFPDESCDIAFLSNVLEHIPTPGPLLAECRRILAPGGMIIGTVPFLMEVHQEPYDFHRYTHIMLTRLLAESGFRDVKVESIGTLFETYGMLQQQFFAHLLAKEMPGGIRRLAARGGRKLFHLATAVFAPVFRSASPSSAYTAGYCFIASK